MKTNRTFLILCSFFTLVLASSCVHNDSYYSPQPQQPGYQYEFSEDFNQDTRGWAFDDPADSAYGLVQNGIYKMVDYSLTGGFQTAIVPTGCNVDGNFSVQTSLQSNYQFALIMGTSQTHNGYSFFIDNDYQQFAIYDEGSASQNYKVLQDWTTSNAINKTGFNKIEVEQQNSVWNFYINNTKVASLQAQYLASDNFGFMTLENMTGQADYLYVKW
jgi:hypothetical protein